MGRAQRAKDMPEEAACYDECAMAIAMISERKAKDDAELDVNSIFGERSAMVTYLRNKIDACDKRLEETPLSHDDQDPDQRNQSFEKRLFAYHDCMGLKLFFFPCTRSRYRDLNRNSPDSPTVE